MRKKLYDLLIAKYILHLVVGEDIPSNAPEEFHIIKLYVRDKDNNLKLYADISLFYLINHSEFVNVEGEPRYIFKSGYKPETESCKYKCMIIPFGDRRGVYRIFDDGDLIKLQSIDSLCELENNEKVNTLVKTSK